MINWNSLEIGDTYSVETINDDAFEINYVEYVVTDIKEDNGSKIITSQPLKEGE